MASITGQGFTNNVSFPSRFALTSVALCGDGGVFFFPVVSFLRKCSLSKMLHSKHLYEAEHFYLSSDMLDLPSEWRTDSQMMFLLSLLCGNLTCMALSVLLNTSESVLDSYSVVGVV